MDCQSDGLGLSIRSKLKTGPNGEEADYGFSFDRVFGPTSTQVGFERGRSDLLVCASAARVLISCSALYRAPRVSGGGVRGG